MVQKTVRADNEDYWGVPGWSIPAYSEVIDYVNRVKEIEQLYTTLSLIEALKDRDIRYLEDLLG